MQVVPLVEGIRRRPRVRVEVELRAQQRNIRLRIELCPTAATCWNELLEARRGAREVATQRRAELADACREGERERVLRIIVENAKERAERRSACRQAATDTIQHDQRVIAISA